MEDSTRPEPSKSRQALHSLVWLIGAVVGVILVQTFLIKPFVIPSESMTPTLQVGDRIMVGKLRWIWSTPERGQIVVFRPPAGALQGEPRCGGGGGLYTQSICTKAWGEKSDQVFFVKRIVAVGGDRVSLRQGRLWLNGKPAREPYVHSVCMIQSVALSHKPCRFPREKYCC